MWSEKDEEEAQFWEWWDSGEHEEQREMFMKIFGDWDIVAICKELKKNEKRFEEKTNKAE